MSTDRAQLHGDAAPRVPPRRICMLVYNNMVHDARVRKEARTLVEAGYDVTVLAVHEPGRTLRDEWVNGFRIRRISRSILGISRLEIGALLRGEPESELQPPPPPARARPSDSRARRLRLAVELKFRQARQLLLYPPRRVAVFLRFVVSALRTKADVFHAHDLNTLLMACAASCLRRRSRLVYDTHEVATEREVVPFRWWACLLERSLIGRADRVICTNATRAEFTQKRYGIPPPAVLRNLPVYVEPHPSALMRDGLGLPADARVVLYQGGLQPGRGLEQLLEAGRDIDGGVLVLLGSGRLKPALMARAADSGLLGTNVYFHDAVPVSELPHWTACAYAGLQLLQNTCFNHYSSLSNKLLEYVMAGIPVIASDLPEMRRVVEQTGAGIVIDASDPKAIARAINALLADPDRRDRMAAAARAARRRYSWEQDRQILADLYAGLLVGGRQQAARG